MGLDMYLTARKYISDYAFQNGEERETIDAILGAVGLDRKALSDGAPGVEVSVNIGYWRKANAIHKWFVDNVQGGVDDCQLYSAKRSDLKELHRQVTEAISNKDGSVLPPKSGFFFGSLEIDQWYWADLKATSVMLNRILNDKAFEGFDFYYQASW